MATRETKTPKTPTSARRSAAAAAPAAQSQRTAARRAPLPAADMAGSIGATVCGPAVGTEGHEGLSSEGLRRLATQKAGTEAVTRAVPFNALKAPEHGVENGHHPQAGEPIEISDTEVTASSVQEDIATRKLGDGKPRLGVNANNGDLNRVRVDSGGQALTTNQGVKVGDNQNSLKAGLRGPTLLEDFILREKITQFDHERIPERVVHARGSAAHGYFECYQPLTDITRAGLFAEAGKRTPLFARFSTVAGGGGSADTVRDTRGFAVKFYTEEGNWDLVGNNIPVFFIQDAMKFPDLIHSVKPEPHHGMPQASSAHDTFYDFISLMPESIHHLMWVMSDRGIPRSLRTMQGFGVHSFRMVDEAGKSVFVKFHWLPVAGTLSFVWDESAKITGADPDFHRRDLWEAIEAGNYPEWELALQVFTEEQADSFSFDVLDATKLIPEELVPLRAVGRMVLNRNPDSFFAETEQVAFCTSHLVPGIDFSNDPLLQGRNHSYLDTQLSRLGGPNFHEIPINSPLAPVHNNQRDGIHRQAISRGRVSYEPNSLAGGCPFQAGKAGFVSLPQHISSGPQAASRGRGATAERNFVEDKVRGKPEKFADHYSQAQLFYRSQTPVEQNHIKAAFRFELTRVTVPAIRERMVSVLANVDPALARSVAEGLGIDVPPAQQTALEALGLPPGESEVATSAGLSLFARPGDGGIKGRRVALLVADGVDGESVRQVQKALAEAGAAPRFVGARLGRVKPASGEPIEVEATMEAMPSVLWDAVVLPGGEAALKLFAANGPAMDFIKEQYRHCKPMLVLGDSHKLLPAAGIDLALPDGSPDSGLVLANGPDSDKSSRDFGTRFIAALGRHRHYEREREPAKA